MHNLWVTVESIWAYILYSRTRGEFSLCTRGGMLRTRVCGSSAWLERLSQHWIELKLWPVWYRRRQQPLDKALVQELGNTQQWTANNQWQSGNLCYKNSRQLQRLCSRKYKRIKLSTTGWTTVVYMPSPYHFRTQLYQELW